MQKFQELLTEAAQLKQAQLKNERKNYESLPEYLKSGLNFSKKYELLRRQDYLIQMTVSERLKRQGNQLFKIDHFPQALAKYEESLGVFRYILAKSFDNMRDEDLAYEIYSIPTDRKEYEEEYTSHLVALYLNICSCLTKLNRKEDAVHSADEALKLKQTAKAHYKKAQAYLQFINRQSQDVKLGFYFLNKSYQLSKDPSIVQQMHKIKKEIDEDMQKEKQWFKFMFDKNSQTNPNKQKTQQQPAPQKEKKDEQTFTTTAISTAKQQQIKNLERERGEQLEKEDVRLQKTKQKLSKFTDPLLQDWLQHYQGEFISRHGSKIYSIIQLYGYREYLGEYKSILAQSLQIRKEGSQKKQEMYRRFFQWLREHPIDKIAKYIERYELQTKWIVQQRENLVGKQGKKEEIDNEQKKVIKVQQTRKEQKKQEEPRKEEIKQEQVPLVKQITKQVQKIDKNTQSVYRQQQIEIEDVPQSVKAAIQENRFTDIQQSKLSQSTEEQVSQTVEQQLSQKRRQKEQNKVKVYSFLIALLIILVLKTIF